MRLQTLTSDAGKAVARFFETKAGKAIAEQALAEEAKVTRNQRALLVTEQRRLRVEGEAAACAHERRMAPLYARIVDLGSQLAAAREQLARAELEYRAAQLPRNQALDRCETQLFASRSHDAVEAFCDELTAAQEGLRLRYDEVKTRGRDGKIYTRWHNGASIAAAHEALARLRVQARALWTEALSDDEIEARFEAMRQSIPAVEGRPASETLDQMASALAGR